MLADTRRVRLLVASGLILAAAVLLRLVTGGAGDSPAARDGGEPRSADVEVMVPADPPTQDNDVDDQDVGQALEVAEAFVGEYLHWQDDEPHGDRLARISNHTTSSLAGDLAAAHRASSDDLQPQTVEVIASQTLTVRRHQIEATIAAEITPADGEPVPTNLTVVLRQEAGRWAVHDLR